MSIKKRQLSADLENDDNISDKSMESSGLMCLVCGAPATGFNFSVITCMCCKAFFRRNALFGLESYQCRYLTDTCSINMRTRRDCSYCRLKKCFQVGMRKELILTEDVKRLKREKIHANRQMTLTLINRPSILNENETIYLRNIFNCYEEYCRSPIVKYEKCGYELISHQPMKSRVKLQNYLEFVQKHQISITDFYQRVPEIQQFSREEQNTLTMHNIRFLMRFNSIGTVDDSVPVWAAVNLLLEIMYGKSIIDDCDQCLHGFKYLLNDTKCIQICLIVLFFSTYPSYKGHIDTLILYRIQTKYTELLWRYLLQNYGELIAYQKFSLIIRYCLRLQILSHAIEVKKKDKPWQDFFISINHD